ncbi:TRAP transporter large permease subunit [Roseomonas sp. AR75]|uniref:TRAP transporter large permease n=1 Tax=Roseomonas sp. AR75 TaxID=2562311 RepID=UPI0010BFAC62|nr:TRAP transporter large permease subunit [Roseomonas sp. AR75]
MTMPAATPPGLAERCARAVAFAMLVLAAGCVVAMTASTVWDVGVRYALNAPTVWATELSTYFLVGAIFLGAAQAHLAEANVRVELLLNALPPAARRDVMLAGAWAGLLVVLIAAWQSALMVVSDYANDARLFSLLLTPTWMPKAPIAIGLSGLALAMLVEIAQLSSARAAWRRSLPWLLVAGLVLLLVGFGRHPPPSGIGRVDAGSVAVLAAVLIGAFASGLRAGTITAAMLLGGIALFSLTRDAGAGTLSLLLFGAIAFFLAIGLRIAFALALVGLLAIYLLLPAPFPMTVAERTWSGVNSFSLTAVPLYVLMGALLVRSRLSDQLFTVMARVLAPLPGGLAHAATAGCGIFAAVSGSSVATAATVGSVACPEMTRRGYSPALAYGSVAAGGTLGILIPPSVPMIIYATTVGVSIVELFLAGILPGLLMMLLFMTVILVWVWLRPEAAPRLAPADRLPLTRASLVDSVLVLLLIGTVIGSLYGGVATASETGAVGAAVALLFCALRGRLGGAMLWACLVETVTVTAFVFLIVVGANVLSYGFDFLKVSQQVMALATEAGLDRWVIFLAIVVVYVALGMFLDSISMLVLTLPVVFPLAQSLGFDPIWLGVILVIMAEVGLITPPVGMNLFVLQGIARTVSLSTIAVGALPFLGAMLATVLLLCLWPDIALLLPAALK